MDTILNFMGNGGIYIAVILLIITFGAAILGSFLELINDPAAAKKSLIGILGLVVLLLIGFALAGGEVPQFAVDKGITPQDYKMIGAVINTALIAAAIVGVYIVVDLISGMFRR